MKFNKTLLIVVISVVLLATLATASVYYYSEKSQEVELAFVGDIMLSRHVGSKIESKYSKFPFVHVASDLRGADLSFGNLETQISDREGIDWKTCCKFKADPDVVRGLEYSGIDVFSVANNHVLDFGPEAFNDTLQILEDGGLTYVGADFDRDRHADLVVKEVKGKKIGFLAYYDKDGNKYIKDESWTPQPEILIDEEFIEDIKKADSEVDILVVSFHWGEEYKTEHNERQEDLAHLAVDNGAEIVVGHHTHVLQEIEEYNGGLIAYSLGNFVFDQPTSKTPVKEGVRDSVILYVKISDNGELSYETTKIRINNEYQPEIVK